MTTRSSRRTARRRTALAVAAATTVAAGLAVRRLAPSGFVADAAGDVLYAALITLVVAFLAPRARPVAVGAIATCWCVAVELFQLTGLPLQWSAAFAPAALVLGTGFSATDLVCYALGAAATAAIDGAVRFTAPGRRPTAARERR